MTLATDSEKPSTVSRIVLFGLVGVAGFAVDAGVLAVVMEALGAYWGRALSFSLAVLATWALNRRTTFADRPSGLSLLEEIARYFAAMCAGGAVNYAVYASAVAIFGADGVGPFAGLAAGSLAGMAVNLTLAQVAVFRS